MTAPALAPPPRTTKPGHGAVRDEFTVEGLRLVEVDHAPALCLGVHAHDVAKVCIVLGGGVSERCGLDVLSPGVFEPVLRPARASHANQYHAEGARSLLLELDPGDRRLGSKADGLAPDRVAAQALAARLYAAFRARRSSRARLVVGAARSLVEAFDGRLRAPVPAWLEAARATLAEEFVDPPALADLGARLGVHPVYLAQAFRARFGVTTRAFVRAHRAFHAMQLVTRGTGLAAAASAAGFSDQSHMTRAIQGERGAPPGRLRRATRS